MKKAIALLAALAVFTSVAFAEAGVSGKLKFGAMGTTSNVTSDLEAVEINVKASVDDYTSVSIQLDSEGTDFTSSNIALDNFSITSNITGALGIEGIDVSLSAGRFGSYFTNWNSVSRTGDELKGSNRYTYMWSLGGSATDLGAAINVGISGFNIQYRQNIASTAFGAAFSGRPVDGLNFIVSYFGNYTDLSAGHIWVDGGYRFEASSAKLNIPVSFTFDQSDSNYTWGSGVAADVDAIHVSAGVYGTKTNMLSNVIAELSTSMVENADLYTIGYFDAVNSNVSVDLGCGYNFGALKIEAGFILASANTVSTKVSGGDGSVTGNGFYTYATLSF